MTCIFPYYVSKHPLNLKMNKINKLKNKETDEHYKWPIHTENKIVFNKLD